MIKGLGVIILLLMSALTGCLAAGGLRKRLKALRQLRAMLEALRLMIRYEALEAEQIAARLADDETLDELKFLIPLKEYSAKAFETGEETFAQIWKRAVEDAPGSFSEEDADLIVRIGANIGVSDCEGQLAALTLACAENERLIAEAQEQYHAKGRLYRALGAVAGAVIAVIAV